MHGQILNMQNKDGLAAKALHVARRMGYVQRLTLCESGESLNVKLYYTEEKSKVKFTVLALTSAVMGVILYYNKGCD